jgi:NitT/TauT family transport system substrate-binding protein
MSRGSADSTVDGWFAEIGKFLVDVGTVPANPAPKDYISDEFLKKVAADPKLRAFATEFDKK